MSDTNDKVDIIVKSVREVRFRRMVKVSDYLMSKYYESSVMCVGPVVECSRLFPIISISGHDGNGWQSCNNRWCHHYY